MGNIIYRDCKFAMGDKIGDFNIMYSATFGHESIIGNYNLLAKTSICSRVKIGSYNLIGNSTTLANTVRLGDDNEIGVGSVVMKNYKNGHHLLGYPAIEIGDFVRKYMRKN
jgi:UDP-3-O-[3-hydroxymyristoyl] glucosamine N-acyltransferase